VGQVTEISWCDSTVNPTSGCDGCELWVPGKKGPCYAGNLHEKRLAKSLPQLYAPDFTEVRLIPGRMAKAARWSDLTGTNRPDKPWFGGGPRVIFIGDMGDTLSKAVPFQFLRTEIIDVVDSPAGRRHVWMWLTKQAARLAEFSAWLLAQDIGWPDNLWPGTSVTRQATLGRAEHLERVGNGDTTRFLSCEPLREELSLLGCLGLAAALGIRGNGDEWGPAYTPFGK
jgi:protein gp37